MSKTILMENVDVIYGIARENSVDVGVGMDMFVSNLVSGKERYKGADGRRVPDYTALGVVWSAMSEEERRAAVNAYTVKASELYNELVELSTSEKCEEMIYLMKPVEDAE